MAREAPPRASAAARPGLGRQRLRAPEAVYLLYLVKLAVFAIGGFAVISATTAGLGGLGGLGTVRLALWPGRVPLTAGTRRPSFSARCPGPSRPGLGTDHSLALRTNLRREPRKLAQVLPEWERWAEMVVGS